MNYCRTLFGGLVILFIAACDTQEPLAPDKKITELKPAETKPMEMNSGEVKTRENRTNEIQTALIDASTQDSAVSASSRPLLKLSIDEIILQDQRDDNDMFFNDHERAEKNGPLLDGLYRKQPVSNFRLSGELLTDENEYETKDLLKSVDGVQINLQGNFN